MHGSQQSNEERLALDLSRRKHFRLDCSIDAHFRTRSGGETIEGDVKLRNIGLGGARIDCDVELPMPCELVLELPELPEAPVTGSLWLDCRVAWTVADRGKGPFPTGLQIVELDEARKKQLFSYIAALMR